MRYIEKVADVGGRTSEKARSGGSTNDKSATTYSISDLFNLVKTYDKEFRYNSVNPALLNEDGMPKVVYHSTDKNFTVFDITKSRSWDGTPTMTCRAFIFPKATMTVLLTAKM